MPPLFALLPPADLLSKTFNYNNKVEVKTTTTDGVIFTSEAVVSKPGECEIPFSARWRGFDFSLARSLHAF